MFPCDFMDSDWRRDDGKSRRGLQGYWDRIVSHLSLPCAYYHRIEKRYGAEGRNFLPMIATAPTLASRGERVHPLPAIRAVK
jgi:hypothetical protein